MEKTKILCSLCPKFGNEKESCEVVQLKCHTFCWICLDKYLRKNLSPRIKCPTKSCEKFIPDNVIRKAIPEELVTKYENLCLERLQQSHRCLLPECNAMIFYTDSNIQYPCQVCNLYNCIKCKAPHAFLSCTQYQHISDINKKRICDDELNRAKELLKRIQRERMRDNFIKEDDQDILLNDYAFSCWLCGNCVAKDEGVKLKGCLHTFCRPCLIQHIVTTTNIPVMCPMRCDYSISDREIQSLLSEDQMQMYQSKNNMALKRKVSNNYQCKYPDCGTIYVYTDVLVSFICVKCGHRNCISCRDVHEEETCDAYQARISSSIDAKFIEENIRQKKLMKCPDCQHLLHKTHGCNWIQCSMCNVELCWIRQMHRWGPKGRGDISGGCGCGINKKFCHPDCRGCIPDSM